MITPNIHQFPAGASACWGYATVAVSSDGATSDVIDVRPFRSASVALLDGTSGDVTFMGGPDPEGDVDSAAAGAAAVEGLAPADGFAPVPDEVLHHGFIKVLHPDATSAILVFKS